MGSRPAVSEPCGQGHLLRSAGLTAGAGCSRTQISPCSTAPTTAGTACRPACWRRLSCSSPTTRCSDAEAKARADFDIRWKVALGIEVEDRPFAKSTLQVFRAQLILHDRVRQVFESSLRLARESGYLKRRSMKVALDTTNILGRGAAKDTYNLLADGNVKLLRVLAQIEEISAGKWTKGQGCHQYLVSNIKGGAAIDWSDKRARTALLAGIVADADRLLELSRQTQGELPKDSAQRQQIVAAAELLGQLLLQDVERTDDGANLKDGVSRDRMMSVHDPEMRQGRKSSSKRFDGHKAAIVVDTDSQLITAVEVLPGNAPDNSGALELVERSESNTGVPVEEAMGDAAYGDGDTRQAFADAGRTLIAWVPGRPDRSHFPKDDFHIDLEAGACTCPAGNVTRRIRPLGTRTAATGRTHQLKAFQFDAAVCGVCPLRPQCVAAAPGTGLTVQLHPQEALLQQAVPYSGVRPLASIGSAGWWWSTGWRGWSNWEPARLATSAASKPGSSCTSRPRWPT